MVLGIFEEGVKIRN